MPVVMQVGGLQGVQASEHQHAQDEKDSILRPAANSDCRQARATSLAGQR